MFIFKLEKQNICFRKVWNEWCEKPVMRIFFRQIIGKVILLAMWLPGWHERWEGCIYGNIVGMFWFNFMTNGGLLWYMFYTYLGIYLQCAVVFHPSDQTKQTKYIATPQLLSADYYFWPVCDLPVPKSAGKRGVVRLCRTAFAIVRFHLEPTIQSGISNDRMGQVLKNH